MKRKSADLGARSSGDAASFSQVLAASSAALVGQICGLDYSSIGMPQKSSWIGCHSFHPGSIAFSSFTRI
jgi:hypothetical protein